MLGSSVAIVTGAGHGIGKAIAFRLAEDGFSVALADVDWASAQSACTEVGQMAGGTPLAVVVDVSDPVSVQEMVGTVIQERGRVDVLINNAGVAGLAAPVIEYPIDEWKRVLSIDLDGVFYCCRAILPHMLRSGSGRIVNIASISGKEGNPNMAAYSSAKAAVIGFTKALAKEHADSGIMINCVTPAVIETDILKQLTPAAVNYMLAKIPIGRPGRPEEVAALVSWLASKECSFSTGAVFDISGGRATY